jgi:hypothetical protein
MTLHFSALSETINANHISSYSTNLAIDPLSLLFPFSLESIWKNQATSLPGTPRIPNHATKIPIAYLAQTFYKDSKPDRNLAWISC